MKDTDRHRYAERLLAAHALSEGDPAAIVSLLQRCEERALPTGQILFRQGDASKEMYFLLEGRARVLKHDDAGQEREIGSWYAPAVVGGIGAVDESARSATCILAAPSVAAVLEGETARRLLAEPGSVGAHLRWILLSAFTETLANTTMYLRQVLSQGESARPNLDEIQAALHGVRR